jgi:pyrroloquinoline quinone biosynthesis protein B
VRIRLLGTGAGGGVPQWNCACRVCCAARAGRIPRRTQASAAVSADGESWLLLHASPDVRQQIESFAPLHPRELRGTPIAGIALANGDLDACLGLFELRESQPLVVLATRAVRRGICERNALVRTLERMPDQITWRDLTPGEEVVIAGLAITAVPVPGKVPLHLHGSVTASPEDNVALRIRDPASSGVLIWAPSVASPSPALEPLLREADCVLFDGTFYSEAELAGAPRMGHWALGGERGSLALLERTRGRRILVHINNTNPILLPSTSERAAVLAAGAEIGEDGMEAVA